MSKFYIGGVANVNAFVADGNGGTQHLFSAKTLTDSSINVSVSNEEIRGGEGAQLLGKFFHTTVFNLSLTDALFDLNYIAKQVGSSVQNGDSVTMKTYNVTAAAGTATLTVEGGDEISPLSFGNMYGDNLICWDADGNTYELTDKGSGNYTFTVGAGVTALCVTAPISTSGKQVVVNAMYYPAVFSLIMRANLFVGDACKASDGQPAGEIVIEIPRFQLDGTIDLAMAMTSPATYALNGSALANGCGCESKPWYAKITEVIFNETEDPFSGYTGIVVDMDNITVGDTLGVYAFAVNKTPKALTPAQYNVTGTGTVDSDGEITAEGAAVITAHIAGSAINGESADVTFEAGN